MKLFKTIALMCIIGGFAFGSVNGQNVKTSFGLTVDEIVSSNDCGVDLPDALTVEGVVTVFAKKDKVHVKGTGTDGTYLFNVVGNGTKDGNVVLIFTCHSLDGLECYAKLTVPAQMTINEGIVDFVLGDYTEGWVCTPLDLCILE